MTKDILVNLLTKQQPYPDRNSKMTEQTINKILEQVVYVAKSNLGYREETGANDGKFIRAIGADNGDNWCAVFASYCYRRAYNIVSAEQLDCPFWPQWVYRPGSSLELQKGAKALVKQLSKIGTVFTAAVLAKPGDLVCWNRGTLGWTGHVGIVESIDTDGLVHSIDGNVSNRVKRCVRDPQLDGLYKFATLRKL